MKRRYISNKKIVAAYEKKAGNLTSTAAALGVHRSTLELWRKEDERLNAAMIDVEESLVDFSESKLMESINNGNLTAIIFHLKTKGKKRGYIESVEQNVNVNPFEQLMKELPDDLDDE